MDYKIITEIINERPITLEKIGRTSVSNLITFLHPITYYMYMQGRYGYGWHTYEPEVIERIFALYPDKLKWIKDMHGAWGVLISKGGNISPWTFENIVHAFSPEDNPDFMWNQGMKLPEMCDAIDTIEAVLPLIKWDYEIFLYIITTCEYWDFHVIRPEYEQVRKVYLTNRWLDFDTPEFKDKIKDTAYEKPNGAIDLYKAQRLSPVEDFLAVVGV